VLGRCTNLPSPESRAAAPDRAPATGSFAVSPLAPWWAHPVKQPRALAGQCVAWASPSSAHRCFRGPPQPSLVAPEGWVLVGQQRKLKTRGFGPSGWVWLGSFCFSCWSRHQSWNKVECGNPGPKERWGPRWFGGGWGELRVAAGQEWWVLGWWGGFAEDARRCSCGGAGERVPWPFSGRAGKSWLDDAADQEWPVQAGPCLAVHGTGSALVRGEPLNAVKKLCTLHLAAAGMKRRGYLFPCPRALKITGRSMVASRLLCTQVQPGWVNRCFTSWNSCSKGENWITANCKTRCHPLDEVIGLLLRRAGWLLRTRSPGRQRPGCSVQGPGRGVRGSRSLASPGRESGETFGGERQEGVESRSPLHERLEGFACLIPGKQSCPCVYGGFYGSGREQASLEPKVFSPPSVSSPSWTAADFGPQSPSNDLWRSGFWTSCPFFLAVWHAPAGPFWDEDVSQALQKSVPKFLHYESSTADLGILCTSSYLVRWKNKGEKAGFYLGFV